jgi:glucose/arabinose dehydrogenase
MVLTIAQPFSNHNGGNLAFGPDGYLYIGTGDGGSGGDPLNNAQSSGTLLGKMLRIDVESGVSPYSIPSDNPFFGNTSYRPEIWALGLRNPWRYSFDQVDGRLFIADVGQDDYEEINVQSPHSHGGENYGWNIMEGAHCYNATTCDRSGLVLPVAEYGHDLGCSITGGMVYRGTAYPRLDGIYFYGDFCSGRIWGLTMSGLTWTETLLIDTEFMITSFGSDEQGTLYFTDYKTGSIYRIIPLP